MLLPEERREAVLIRRYKRFLADVRLEDGRELTAHCPNSGAMLGCSEPGSRVVISRSDNPGRKYAWTLEMIRVRDFWVGLHTGRTNALVQEGLETGVINVFRRVRAIRREVRVSPETRLDFLLETSFGPVFLEVKHCSLAEDRVGLFPDAVTARGAKHMRELGRLAAAGERAAVLYCVQRADAKRCAVAAHIDPGYAETVREAMTQGVRFFAWLAEVRPDSLRMTTQIPFSLEA